MKWFKKLFEKKDSPYRSPVIVDGNMVTLNKKKDILSEDFISSGSKKIEKFL